MPRLTYCFRLGKSVPLLTDEEYEKVRVHLSSIRKEIWRHRREHGSSLSEAYDHVFATSKALDVYETLTGYRLEHTDQLHAIRLSLYGRPCPECSKPFRTPRARLCAECGFKLPDGEVAGPA